MAFVFPKAAVAALSLVAAFAHAQTAVQPQAQASSYTPSRGQPGKDVIWIATPNAAVTRMLQMAQVKSGDLVVDLGSGDGKIPIAAAREFGATARGLEYNPKLVEHSKVLAQQAGVADKVTFEQADIFESDFSKASVVTMYLLPQLNLKLRPTLLNMAPGTRVVSHSFTMGDWVPDESSRVGTAELMLWHVPANVSGEWRLKLNDQDVVLKVHQQFQMLRGEARLGELTASLIEPRIHSDRVHFGVRDAQGKLWHFSGQVKADRIDGEVTSAGIQTSRAFVAERTGGKVADLSAPMPPRYDMVIE